MDSFARIRSSRPVRLGLASLLLVSIAGAALAAPATVRLSYSIDNGSWIPIPADDMMEASLDAAIARISEGGWLRIVRDDAQPTEGKLEIDITLVAKAQIAKSVITLELLDEATYVSTASVSVRGLDTQGFHRAFEHIGRESADRLHATLIARRGGPARIVSDGDDDHWRAVYNEAQEKKHAQAYGEASLLFGQVAASSGRGTERLVLLAQDELRYGLPAFEAKHSLIGLAGPGRGRNFETSLSRAEGLYRQIQAENPTNMAREQEAQFALDQIAIARSAYDQAIRSQVYMRFSQVRIQLTETFFMEGQCPDAETVRRVLERGPFSLEGSRPGSDESGAIVYELVDAESGQALPLACDERSGFSFDMN